MMRVCAPAMRLIARALAMNFVTSDPREDGVTAFGLAAGSSGVFGGLGVRSVML
jgi:hypothetical protein